MKRARSLSSIFTSEDEVLKVDAGQADESLAVCLCQCYAALLPHCICTIYQHSRTKQDEMKQSIRGCIADICFIYGIMTGIYGICHQRNLLRLASLICVPQKGINTSTYMPGLGHISSHLVPMPLPLWNRLLPLRLRCNNHRICRHSCWIKCPAGESRVRLSDGVCALQLVNCGLSDVTIKALEARGITALFPIQKHVYEPAAAGRLFT